ncbi:MICOS complex subunit Mic10-like [Oppia nitens]|uniref:MICOS complex subunit Mic10-like n=1 Tax=Oppia nitens TaxID=1686743 RepID=UPI0023DBD76B|nr:MICOS complex subunit Mic10-like [Oppia nitens]
MSVHTTTAAVIKSEDQLGRCWDKFAANSALKMGTGLAVGTVFSVLIFRRRVWPMVFGLGTGFGFAVNQLQTDLNQWSNK